MCHLCAICLVFLVLVSTVDANEARFTPKRCFARLSPGQLLDTTMDKVADSIAVDSTGDGKVDKIVKLEDAE